jgi:hypothetical protein
LESGDLFVVEANEYHLHGARAGGTARVFQVKASGYFHDVGLAEDYLMQPGGWSPEQKIATPIPVFISVRIKLC